MAPASSLLVELGELLYRKQEWSSRAEIAAAMNLHQQVITPWLNYLEFFRATRGQGGDIHVSEDRLLATIANYRAGNLRPARPRSVQTEPGEIHDQLDDAGVPHAFGMFTAANRWAFYEPHRDIHLYVPRSDRSTAREALERLRQERSEGEGRLQVFHETIEGVATQDRENLPVTTPFQTVVDLRAHPEGGAHADFLETNLLPRLRGSIE